MLGNIVLLTVTYIFAAAGAPTENLINESSVRGSPLTNHLMKFLNHFDDSIIGFHLVVPRDDVILNSYVDKPPHISKILEYVTQINYLRNMIENDPEVSIKKSMKSEKITVTEAPKNSSDPHHTDILIFSQVSPQRQANTSKKADADSVIFVPYPMNQDVVARPHNITSNLYSKSVSHKTKSSFDSKKKCGPILDKSGNYSILKQFEEGLRIYPLISMSQRKDNIDCFTGKVNCSQNEICFMSRVRREPTEESSYSGSCSFLIQPRFSVNPSLLFVPKSLDNLHSLDKSTVNKSVDDDNLRVSENPKLHQSITFLAPIFDSALAIPLKACNKASNNYGESVKRENDEYPSNGVNKRESIKSNSTTQDRYNNCSGLYDKDDNTAFASFRNSQSLNSPPANSFNETPSNCDPFVSDSFADILRQSISDLVNGINPDPSAPDSSDKPKPVMSNSSLNGYNVYFLINPANEYYSDNISTNESNAQSCEKKEEECSSYVDLGNCWPYLLKNKSTLNKPSEDLFLTNSDVNDAFNSSNSFYRDKISEILSFARNRFVPENQEPKKSKRACEDENIKKCLFKDTAEGGGEGRENDSFSYRIRKETGVNGAEILTSDAKDMISFLSNILSTNGSHFFKDTDDLTMKEGEKSDYLTGFAPSANKMNILNRIMRSLGRKITMIPKVDKNFDLLIVYPYHTDNDACQTKTVVSKSVKKYNGYPSDRQSRLTPPPLNVDEDVLQKLMNVTQDPDCKVQLHKEFLNELSRQKCGNPDSKDESTSHFIQRLVDALRPVTYYKRDESDSDVKLDKRYKGSLLPSMFSFKSPLSKYVASSAQNLSTLSEDKLPLNLSDFQTIRLLQSVTAAPSSSQSNVDTKLPNELNLLRNLSVAVTLDALKLLQETPPASESKSNKVITTTEYLGLSDSSEPLNTSNLENPFHSSNGFRVSNATNLLIKLTELKSLNVSNDTSNPADDLGYEATQSTEPAVSNGIILFQNLPSTLLVNSYGKVLSTTEKMIGPLIKSSLFISALVSNNSKMPKNNSGSMEPSQNCTATDDIKLAQSCNRSDGMTSVTEDGNKEFFTYSLSMLNSCSSSKTGSKKVESSLAHSIRPWVPPIASTPSYDDDNDDPSDENEDVDISSGYGISEITPVISVNIFPVLGGWRKPQIEATALIKQLFRTSKKRVEEEQLPTYLSELFDTEDEIKIKQNSNMKEYNSTQRKLDAILSGKGLINDVMKYKVQNILQLSTKPGKAILPRVNQSIVNIPFV